MFVQCYLQHIPELVAAIAIVRFRVIIALVRKEDADLGRRSGDERVIVEGEGHVRTGCHVVRVAVVVVIVPHRQRVHLVEQAGRGPARDRGSSALQRVIVETDRKGLPRRQPEGVFRRRSCRRRRRGRGFGWRCAGWWRGVSAAEQNDENDDEDDDDNRDDEEGPEVVLAVSTRVHVTAGAEVLSGRSNTTNSGVLARLVWTRTVV